MSVTQACLNIQFLNQKLSHPPFLLIDNFNTIKLEPNPQYYKKHIILGYKFPPVLKLIWEGFKLGINVAHIFSVCRVMWLAANWKKYPDFEQLSYYILAVTITLIGLSAYSLIENNVNESCYLVTQRFKLIPHSYYDGKMTSKRPNLVNLLMYGFAISFLAFPLIFGAVPLFRSYDIVQAMVDLVLRTFIFQSGLLALHGCAVVLSLLVPLGILNLEAISKIARNDLFPRNIPMKNGQVRKVIKFGTCVNTFRILQILIFMLDQLALNFISVLTGMGILAASSSGYIILIKSSSENFPFIMYLSCCIIFGTAIAVDFIFVTLASIPGRYGEQFRLHWKMGLTRQVEKQVLRACPVIGFSVGFLRNVRAQTALSIADTILNITATMVLTTIGAGRHIHHLK